MTSKDKILRATAANDQFRVFAVDASQTAQAARDLHDLSPLSAILMGRLIAATAMLGLELKSEGNSLTLKLDCEGELKGGLIICEHGGFLRAYVKNPRLWFDTPEDNFLVGKHVGKGTLSIIKDLGLKTPFSGISELVTGEIGDDLAAYYYQSEQIPTAVNLGVLIDKEARIRACGGFIVQQMPGADLSRAEQLIQNINSTPNVSDLMDMGMDIREILDRFVLKGISWNLLGTFPLQYQCNCSRDRFERALLLLGVLDLESMQEGINPICMYCNKEYCFDREDIQNLINELKHKES
ncbi:MAG: Hsp33 family molecular chaperone HslO [Candidatus Cloacimonetes bacterium]|nr:Hsp33 family molecular chaperone HslO [Candidatus Cloacimonadota bacterium]